MTALETRGREQVLAAARWLVEDRLIARTWGNISVRVSETQFLITPSGLAYETMRADQLVLVDIADGSYRSLVKPSSEKGIHAAAYRLRPEVRFVIHTHQYWASVAGIAGTAVTGFIHPLLGKRIPCAAYGLPGTKSLRRAVETEMAAWPDCRAFLLRNHGALCLGRDMEDAFAAARALEEVCENRVMDAMGEPEPLPVPPDLGSSIREGDSFILTRGGVSRRYPLAGTGLPSAAARPAAGYRGGNFRQVVHVTGWETLAVCGQRRLRPYLDDLAQIAGADIRCVPPDPKHVEKAIRGRNAVLLRSAGALCAGTEEGDAEAVRVLLRKGCAACLYAREVPRCRPLSEGDARVQRFIYQRSYARKKPPC